MRKVDCRLWSRMYGKRKCGWKEWEQSVDWARWGSEAKRPFAAVYSHKFLLGPPLVRDGSHKVFLTGAPQTHTDTHTRTCTLRQGEYSLSHFIPWWMRPYSSEPQWSQKVGLP